MSHPVGISVLLRRRISRMRRRMRLRTTAPPSAFFTLMPNRLERRACRERRGRGTLALAQKLPPGGFFRKRNLRAEENGKLRARAALTGAVYGFVFDALQ